MIDSLPFASIIIVSANRPKLLRDCLRSIQEAPCPFLAEILVVLNGDASDPGDLLAEGVSKVISSQRITPAAARNLALSQARGRFVCFLDDDAAVPRNYFNRFQKTFLEQSDLEILGGPDRTFPGSSAVERAIGLTLMSPLATAKTRHRHGSAKASAVTTAGEAKLILCNLWMDRSIFSKDGHRFDERFMRNEENVLLYGLSHKKALYDPELFVHHRRKTGLRPLCKAVFQSGYFRARSSFLFPGSVSFEFTVPSLFLLYLGALALAPSFSKAIPLFLYGALNLGFAVALAMRERDFLLVPLIAFYQCLINITYGAGFTWGLVKSLSRLKRHDLKSTS